MLASLIENIKTPALSCLRSIYTSPWKNPNEVHHYLWRNKNFRVNKTRCYFPRPSELMRVRKHGFKTRMATEGGRKVIMSRILKGRHVLSH